MCISTPSDDLTRVTRGENPQVIPGCRGLPLPEGCELTSELLPERLASFDGLTLRVRGLHTVFPHRAPQVFSGLVKRNVTEKPCRICDASPGFLESHFLVDS